MSKTTTILNFDQSFRLGGYNLSGVSDITFNSEFSAQKILSLGNKNYGFARVGPAVGAVDFSRQLIYADPVLSYTGDSCCSGVFSYGGVSYGFESGYLNSYSVSCSVGQVPSVSATIGVYGEMKSGAANHTGVTHPDIFVPSQKSIQISSDYGSSNRIESFNYSLEIAREPKYSVGPNLFPDAVIKNGPINISASATFGVGGFSALDLQNFVRYVSAPTFNIVIKNRDLSQTLMTLPVSNAQIISQQVEGTVDSPLKITLNYQGYLE